MSIKKMPSKRIFSFSLQTLTLNLKLLFLLVAIFTFNLEPRALSPLYAASKGNPPVAYWRFDEGAGTTAYDDSSNNNDLAFYHEVSWKTGKYGMGLQFDGTDDVVTCASSAGGVLNPSGTISVSAWIYINGTKSNNYIVTKGWGDVWELTLDGNNKLNFRIVNVSGGAQQSVVSNTALQNDQWNYVAGTYDQQNIKVYINGALDKTQAYTLTIAQTAHKVAVGGIPHMETSYYGNGFNGKIDDVRIYNYTRTADQIMIDYNAGSATYLGAGVDPNEGNPPVGYWKMDENTGGTAYDRSGNGNNGTVTGATWTQGKNGSSLTFDGNGANLSAVNIGNVATANFGTGNFTVSLWVKRDAFGPTGVGDNYGYGGIIDKRYYQWKATDIGWGLGTDNSSIKFEISNGTLEDSLVIGSENSVLPRSRWTHLAISVNRGGNIVAYRDGVQIASMAASISGTISNSESLDIASSGGWTSYGLRGLIDDVKIYDYARTPGQIAYDYNKAKPVAYYKFDEGGGVIAHNEYSSSDTGVAPVGWWRMDNNWNDESGNAHNGTAYNQAAFSSSSKIGPYCGTFDGAGDYVNVGTVTGYSSALTVEAWVNHSASADWDDIVAGGSGDILYGFNNNSLSFGGQSNSPFTPIAYGTNINGAWHHVAGVYNGSTAKLYVDGVEVASSSKSGSFTPGSLNIGGSGTGESFTGLIDDARIYNYARTPEQIYNDYKTTHGTLAGDAKFVDGKVGKALQFDGTGDYVTTIFTRAELGTYYSMGAWFKYEGVAGRTYSAIFGGFDFGAGTEFFLGKNNGNTDIGWQDGNYISNMGTGTSAFDGNWHYIAITMDSTTGKLYLDGNLLNTQTFTKCNDSEVIYIGTETEGGGYPWIGKIDDVRIYKYVRTADQVLQDYNAGTASYTGGQTAGMSDPWAGAVPVNHWKLDENTGVLAKDASGNGNNGTMSGATWVQGKKGSGLSFDGSDYLLLASTISLSDTANWTVSAWVKTTSSGNNTILSNSSGGPVTSALRLEASKICYSHYDGAWQNKYGTSSIANGNWHFLTWVNHSNQTIDLYVDGVRETAGVASTETSNGPVNQIGRDWGATANASIDDVRVYNYAMTQAQVSWLYNGAKPIAYWRFDEAVSGAVSTTAGAVKDDSGNNNATASNTTWTYGAGKFGGCLNLDGNDQLTAADSLSLKTQDAMTLSMWVYPNQETALNPRILRKYDDANNNYQIYSKGVNSTSFGAKFTRGGSAVENQASMTFSWDTWYHLTVVYNAGAITFYINGTAVSNTGGISAGVNTSTSLTIGNDGGSSYFKGKLDDVRVYNYARTADQILQDYNAGLSTTLSE